MASPACEPTSARKLTELRVIDLKAQLEKRGIERTGVKASLIDRLKKALEDEGHEPDEYIFELDMKKLPKSDVKDREKDGDEDAEDEDVEMEVEADNTLTEETTPEAASQSEVTQPQITTCNSGGNTEETADSAQVTADSAQVTADSAQVTADSAQVTADSAAEETLPEDTTKKNPDTTNGGGDDVGDEKEVEEDSEEMIVQDEVDVSEMEASSTTTPSNQKAEEKSTDAERSGEKKSAVSEPPSPSSVPVLAPFTVDDTVKMDTSSERTLDEDISLIVHIDESQMDLDNDLLATPVKSTEDKAEQSPADQSTAGNTAAETATDHCKTDCSGAADSTTSAKSDKSETKQGEEEDGQPGTVKNEEARSTAGDRETTTQSNDSDKAKSTAAAKPGGKDDKAKSVPASSRNLWISGLASTTRATDLKTLFSKYGKVAGAKVVTNAKSPGSRCYGFVTMSTADEASKCIQHLHRTELHGKMISVERAKSDPSAQAKIAPKASTSSGPAKRDEPRDRRDDREDRRPGGRRTSGHGSDRDRRAGSRSRDRRDRRSSGHTRRSPVHTSRPEPSKVDSGPAKSEADSKADSSSREVLDFEKIKAERERERLRERERRMRAEERRRMDELERMKSRQREVERKQREESVRLEREKQRLKFEQQRLELERLEAERERIALERERQRRERERLEKERDQERQAQLRLEQERRAMKRNFESRGAAAREDGGYWNDAKRQNIDRSKDTNVQQRHSKHEERGGNEFERRVERYDRREGRSSEQTQRGADRYENRRGDDRHETRREAPPAREARDRDDRSRGQEERTRTSHENRYDRYEERRDSSTVSRNHDNRQRHERDRSPHRGAPLRTSPGHRQNDNRNEWKSERTSVPQRENRDRRQPTASDRNFTDSRTATNRDTGNWHNSRTNNSAAQDDRSKAHSYNSGPGLLGNAPGSMGDHQHQHQWGSGDRNTASSSQQISSRPTERSWPGPPGQSTDRVGVRPQPSSLPVQQPLLSTPPTSAAFLASAANIMMGVGLAGNRNTAQDTRYDAYKNLQGGNVRRY